MSFMPGDSKRGMPRFVEVEWMVADTRYETAWKNLANRSDKYSKEWISDVTTVNANAPQYIRRVDLTPILTPQLIEQVRQDSQNTQLKLTITFKYDQVEIKAEAYKWRK